MGGNSLSSKSTTIRRVVCELLQNAGSSFVTKLSSLRNWSRAREHTKGYIHIVLCYPFSAASSFFPLVRLFRGTCALSTLSPMSGWGQAVSTTMTVKSAGTSCRIRSLKTVEWKGKKRKKEEKKIQERSCRQLTFAQVTYN